MNKTFIVKIQERLSVLAAPRMVRSTFHFARLRSAGGVYLSGGLKPATETSRILTFPALIEAGVFPTEIKWICRISGCVEFCEKRGCCKRAMMDAREYLEILHVAERLKDTTRHCTTTKGRIESVAEHSWRISLMAYLLKYEFQDADIDKVIRMCLIHDLGECFTGDIPTFIKTDKDRDKEDSLLDQWVGSLPPEVSSDMRALFEEMNAQQTKEAKLYKALDKLEALIQHNESPIDTWSENEYELNKRYAFDAVEFSDWLSDLRREILADTLEKIEKEGKR